MRFALLLAIVASGCGNGATPTPAAAPAPAPTPAPAAPAPAPTPTQPPSPTAGPACTTDLDCRTCGLRSGCRCALAPDPGCGPMAHPCVAEPCHSSSASCWDGRCQLRPASAEPCSTDAECEVRADDCRCDLFAALVSSRGENPCPGRGCGGRPAPSQYRARCNANAQRCVLERR